MPFRSQILAKKLPAAHVVENPRLSFELVRLHLPDKEKLRSKHRTHGSYEVLVVRELALYRGAYVSSMYNV